MTLTAHNHRRFGFTLLELSIVVTLLSLILVGIMQVQQQKNRINKQAELKMKMDAIETGLLQFRLKFNRLPCPAFNTTSYNTSSVTFGQENNLSTAPTATGVTNCASPLNNGAIYAGGVPVRTLSLPDDYAFDPWGGRFTYVVDNNFAVSSAFSNNAATNASGGIWVMDADDSYRTKSAIAVVISHGPDGHGAYQASGAIRSSGSNDEFQLKNCHCNNAAAPLPASPVVYLTYPPTHIISASFDNKFYMMSPTTTYDDITRYYTREQFISSTGEGLTEKP